MKRTLALLVASTALTAAIGLPAWGAMRALIGDAQPFAEIADAGKEALPLVLASDDDDDDREHRRSFRRDHDNDDDREHRTSRYDDDEDEDDEDDGRRGRNPAPAGSIAPPQNGLFGNGTPPKVQVN